jgi:hypothetical protein
MINFIAPFHAPEGERIYICFNHGASGQPPGHIVIQSFPRRCLTQLECLLYWQIERARCVKLSVHTVSHCSHLCSHLAQPSAPSGITLCSIWRNSLRLRETYRGQRPDCHTLMRVDHPAEHHGRRCAAYLGMSSRSVLPLVGGRIGLDLAEPMHSSAFWPEGLPLRKWVEGNDPSVLSPSRRPGAGTVVRVCPCRDGPRTRLSASDRAQFSQTLRESPTANSASTARDSRRDLLPPSRTTQRLSRAF